MDRVAQGTIIFDGGLDIATDLIEQAEQKPGSARSLINYEPAEIRGYRRVLGYLPYSTTAVTGNAGTPVLGLSVYRTGVLAARLNATSNDIFYSTGTTWTKINTAARAGSVSRVRFYRYFFAKEKVAITDGVNPALIWDGTTDTLINGTGSPTNPSVSIFHGDRLVLGGYTSATNEGSRITITAPGSDTDCDATNSAIEINIGDKLVGFEHRGDALYLFCQKSIRKLIGSTSADFEIVVVTEQVGCISADTIQSHAGDVIFLSQHGFRSLASTEKLEDVDVSLQSRRIQPLIDSILSVYTSTNFSSCTIPGKTQYRFFYYDNSTTDTSQKGLIAKFKPYGDQGDNYQWSELLGIPAKVCASGNTSADDSLVIFSGAKVAGVHDGKVYSLEQGNTFNGSDINCEFTTPSFIFQDSTKRKTLLRTRTTTQSDSDQILSLRAIIDEELGRTIQPSSKSVTIYTSTFKWGTMVWGSFTWGRQSKPQVAIQRLEGTGSMIALRYTSTGNIDPHRLDSVVIEYKVKSDQGTTV